jgi:hypothetical protein
VMDRVRSKVRLIRVGEGNRRARGKGRARIGFEPRWLTKVMSMATALLTMAPLTMAPLTMAPLTMALLTTSMSMATAAAREVFCGHSRQLLVPRYHATSHSAQKWPWWPG